MRKAKKKAGFCILGEDFTSFILLRMHQWRWTDMLVVAGLTLQCLYCSSIKPNTE